MKVPFKKYLFFLSNPLVLSVLIGVPVIFLIPGFIHKYNARQIDFWLTIPSTTNAFYDLDYNGNSEKISFFNTPVQPSIIIWDNMKILSQYVFRGEFLQQQFFSFVDYDGDNLAELYLLTLSNDSIYINMVKTWQHHNGFIYKKYIDNYHSSKIGFDAAVYFARSTDLNKDGFKEIVFIVSTGWSAYPRKLYALDIRNDTVLESPASCAAKLNPIATDINGDGFDEFLFETYAFANCTKQEPYNDSSTWLMALNRNLNWHFPPVRLGPYPSGTKVTPIICGDSVYLLVLSLYSGTEKIENYLYLYSSAGKMIKKKEMDEDGHLNIAALINRNETDLKYAYLIYRNGKIVELDTELAPTQKFQVGNAQDYGFERLDVDLDGEDEFIFLSFALNHFIIARNDFRFPVTIHTPKISKAYTAYFSIIDRKHNSPMLYYQNGEFCYTFEYLKNPWYPFRFLFYLSVFTFLFLFFFLIQRIQRIRERHRMETLKRINDLQLKSLKEQVDSHFALNLINSVNALFDRQDREKAGYVLNKYSTLLRTALLSTDSIERTLEKELEFTRNYLDLELFRYNNKFSYEIIVTQGIDMLLPVPKLIVHTFVENAIKHGLRHLEKDGSLAISISSAKESIIITIANNGDGIHRNQNQDASTGKGLKIADSMLQLYYDLTKIRITYEINSNAIRGAENHGTVVNIRIPFKKSLKTRK